MRVKFLPATITILGVLILCLLPFKPVMGAAGEGTAEVMPEIGIDTGYPDTIHIVAENYAAKVDSAYDLISCIGPIKTRPDDGLIFLSADTAIYLGLPSPETHQRKRELAAAVHHIIILRNLNEGFNASRMFDLSRFDAIILNAPEVGEGLTAQDIMADLGYNVADFQLHLDAVPNKVVFLTSPIGGVVMKRIDTGAGLYKTVLTFHNTSLSVAIYWLEDATCAIKAYNPHTNGKILALDGADDWKKMMSNENFAKDINADLLSAIVMPGQPPQDMIKSAAKAGAQRIVTYSYTEDEITAAPTNPLKMMTTSNNVTIFNCLYPEMVLFCYQT